MFCTEATSLTIPSVEGPMTAIASSRVFLLRPVMATFAPSLENNSAVARPIPLLPPITTAILFANLFMFVVFYGFSLHWLSPMLLVIKGEIIIILFTPAPKTSPHIRRKRKTILEPDRQVRIGAIETAECDQI